MFFFCFRYKSDVLATDTREQKYKNGIQSIHTHSSDNILKTIEKKDWLHNATSERRDITSH